MDDIRKVLTIAGSDSSGGAGIEADLKTICAMHMYGEVAITALTAQNTTGVYGVFDVPPEFVAQQIDCDFDDIRPDAVKIGMVSNEGIIAAIASRLTAHKAQNIVVDPVMVAESGGKLMMGGAAVALRRLLFPLACVITPNIYEAQVLSGIASIESTDDMLKAAHAIADGMRAEGLAVPAILLKGGHLKDSATDLLLMHDGDGGEKAVWLEASRIDNVNTHGTGCTLSSAIACGLAAGLSLEQAVREAKEYLRGTLLAGLDLGHGRGPLNHLYRDMGI